MTYAPATIVELAVYWTDHGGVNLGIVGDAAHQAKGTSYHLGKSQLAAGAYSARTPRDRAGLTEAASALDLGRLGGSLAGLRDFSVWFVERCRANAPGTVDVREVIYSPDGTTVLRWDRERGYASDPKPGEADDTHRTHTHISFYRDAELRPKVELFRPYFEEAEMFAVQEQTPLSGGPRMFRVAAGATINGYSAAQPGRVVRSATFTAASSAHASHRVRVTWVGTAAPPVPKGYPFLLVVDGTFAGLLIVEASVTLDPDPPVIDQGDVDAASRKGWNDGRAAAIAAAQTVPVK